MSFRYKLCFAALAIAALAAPAGAAMTVGTFVERANGIRSLGFAAMLTPDFQVLKGEAAEASAALRAENRQRIAAKKPPLACIPEGESVGIEEMIDSLAALPADYQRRPLKDGYARVIAAKFPCR